MKIDWFWIVIGILWLILAGFFYSKISDYFIFIYVILAVMSFFKSYYQERMSILYWLKNKKKKLD